jgi:hypothetical protein
MYLYAENFFTGSDYAQQEEKDAFKAIVEAARITPNADSPMLFVKVNVGYWRKANAIHNWFVNNVQDGVDECQESEVSAEQLDELLKLCQSLLADKSNARAMDELPPQEGFFFGSTDLDEGYWQDIEATIDIINKVKANKNIGALYYRASW